MSAEEWIYDTYGGVSSDDLTDGFGNDALYAGGSTSPDYGRISKSTHTHNPNNKKLPYIAKHEVKPNIKLIDEASK